MRTKHLDGIGGAYGDIGTKVRPFGADVRRAGIVGNAERAMFGIVDDAGCGLALVGLTAAEARWLALQLHALSIRLAAREREAGRAAAAALEEITSGAAGLPGETSDAA
jgi:hypothetical protein